jgi:hypothetical protein
MPVNKPSGRRHRRSERLADALRLQLEACREDEGLAAIVVSDELGFCVAHSGGDGGHEELAAHLPMLADPAVQSSVDTGEVGLAPGSALTVATFSVGEARLHACAVTEPDSAAPPDAGAEVLARVAGGFARLLAQ